MTTGTGSGMVMNRGPGGIKNHAKEAMLRLFSAEEKWNRVAERFAREEEWIDEALSRLLAEDAPLLHLRWMRKLPWYSVAILLQIAERTARHHHEPALIAFWEAYKEGEKRKEKTA